MPDNAAHQSKSGLPVRFLSPETQSLNVHVPTRKDIENALAQVGSLVHASLRPLPTTTGDGTYLADDSSRENIFKDMASLKSRDIPTLLAAFKASQGQPVDDKLYLIERLIQLASDLPMKSQAGKKVDNELLAQLWSDIQHPPLSYFGDKFVYRQADGSYNNILFPHVGAAGTPYARTIRPALMCPVARPDPGALFDSLLVRKSFKPHPTGISSVLFYLALTIIHDCFRTSHSDVGVSDTSSYLDLSPLYGANQEEQRRMRTFKDGKLHPDCFSDKRLLGMPPGVCVLLVMFNRFHNYVVENLALIDENKRFSKLRSTNDDKYDEALFQTGRLVTCGLYVNIILKDYIRTILGLNRINNAWDLDPRSDTGRALFGKGAQEAGGNQVSIEFNLIYRWHSCLSERDAKHSEEEVQRMFPGAALSEMTTAEFAQKLSAWQESIPQNPQDRSFGNLKRGESGSFQDDELAKIWSDSVEDRAGAFGVGNIPSVMKIVEIMSIEQARGWALGSLNEFRKYFNLTPHKTFEDINPDPYIANQLKHLYDHPDFVEMYPGIIVEATKEPMYPGSGLCGNFTMTRAILSDALALVRGDRFHTVEYSPANLTNWGFTETNYDLGVNNGCVFYKLVLRALPHNFQSNSVYAHYPLVVPSENQHILGDLALADQYSFDKPTPIQQPTFITSYAACDKILKDQSGFRVTWGKPIEFLVQRPREGSTYGRDFMLSGDEMANTESRKMMYTEMYHKGWEDQVKQFYEETMMDLLQKHSYEIAGVKQVDIVRDVVNLAHARFVGTLFSFPMKTEDNPRGVYAETELYGLLALNFVDIFYDVDAAKSFSLHQSARKLMQQLGSVYQVEVEAIANSSAIMDWLTRPARKSALPGLPDYGVHMIKELLKTGIPPKDLVWTHILPFAGGSVANQAQLFSQCLDYYLSDDGKVHLPEINRLAKLNTAEADDKLLHYFMEGSRLSNTVGLYRDLAKPCDIQDGQQSHHLKAGDRVLCDLATASIDPDTFPEPTEVKLDRPLDSYIQFGKGPHQCIGLDWAKVSLPTMLKCVGRLGNLRRAPGPQGEFKKVPQPGGFKIYLTADESSYTPFPAYMKVQWDGDLLGNVGA